MPISDWSSDVCSSDLAKLARAAAAVDVPLMVQVTVEPTGTLLVGADVAAAATVLKALDVPIDGLNRAPGPQDMAPHPESSEERRDGHGCYSTCSHRWSPQNSEKNNIHI